MIATMAPAGIHLSVRTALIGLVIVGLLVARRLRPQRVRASRSVILAVLVTLTSGATLVSTGPASQQWLVLALAPVFLAAGVWLGLQLTKTMTFWRDEETGQLWMRGGAVYVAVWLATLALRVSLRLLGERLGGPGGHAAELPPAMAALSADPVLLSVGLWIGRSVAIVRKARDPA